MSREYWAVVSFGGHVSGATGVYASEAEAREKVIRAERDSHCGGRYATDRAVLARARLQCYATRREAQHADISDGSGPRPQVKPLRTVVMY